MPGKDPLYLELENISRFVPEAGQATGRPILCDLNLKLEAGQLYILLGPAGAGKTTLLRILAGLERADRGRLLIHGQDRTGVGVRKRNVAMVYQQFINYPSLTVFENIASPLRIKKLPEDEIRRRVEATAERLQISDYLTRLPTELSGGQRQRLALARALVKDAELTLLDEPLVNLDYKLRENLRREIRELFRERKSALVYATAEPAEALLLGGKVIILNEGRLLQQGSALEVYQKPASLQAALIYNDPPMNIFSGVSDQRGRVRLEDGTEFSPVDVTLAAGKYLFGVRAHHISLSEQSPADIEFRGKVELTEIAGSETFVHTRHGAEELTIQEKGVHHHAQGADFSFYIHPERFFIFTMDGERLHGGD